MRLVRLLRESARRRETRDLCADHEAFCFGGRCEAVGPPRRGSIWPRLPGATVLASNTVARTYGVLRALIHLRAQRGPPQPFTVSPRQPPEGKLPNATDFVPVSGGAQIVRIALAP